METLDIIQAWKKKQEWWLTQFGFFLEVNHHYGICKTQPWEPHVELYLTHSSRKVSVARIKKNQGQLTEKTLGIFLDQMVDTVIGQVKAELLGTAAQSEEFTLELQDPYRV